MLFDEFFDNFFDDFNVFSQPSYYTTERSSKKCPVCGRTVEDFRRLGKCGCGECYKTFREPVESVIKQIHPNAAHTGKIPSKSGEGLKKKRLYNKLKADLQAAVQSEDYETAAKLHKQIREMENEVK
ncbi:MAG: UvrB/UvrC motif-containing protein [Firmicutes bacterium]|nr:UvrB/UvrC motif-containing protein [Bacillota bacterium]